VTTFAVAAGLKRTDITRLCDEMARAIEHAGAGREVVCDVAAVTQPTMITLEAIARLDLTARRHGRRLVVRGACAELRQLASLLGLDGLLPQVGGQAEEREETRGVEEIRDPGDPPV
jgi:hypothetical protein